MSDTHVIYLDNAATTRMHPAVFEAMKPYFAGDYFNPSSLYAPAQREKAAIEKARSYLASTIGARTSEIRFTSGGSESDNAALKGIMLANQDRGNHLIVSSVEHHAVLESAHWLERHGFEVTYLPVNAGGSVLPDSLRQAMRPETVLVSVMAANNEVGTLQPIAQLAEIAHENGALFHTDAVQAYGHVALNVVDMGIDALSVSAHKLHGPKGVGFLYCKRGVKTEPLISGGAQERGYRAGTENVAGIIGMAEAAKLAFGALTLDGSTGESNMFSMAYACKCMREMAAQFRATVENAIQDVRFNGCRHEEGRLPGIVSVSFKGVSGEALLALLDQKGVCASAGSACASGSLEMSHVLKAMGVAPEWAPGTIRFSFSPFNSAAEVETACRILGECVRQVRSA